MEDVSIDFVWGVFNKFFIGGYGIEIYYWFDL